MRLEFNVCTCYWMTHPPSQLAAIPGCANVGLSQQARSDGARRPRRAEISRCSLHSPSSSSRPSVP